MSFRDQDTHKHRRKLLSRGFSQASMLDFEGTMSSKIQTLMDQLASIGAGGKSFDVYPWCLWLGFDTVYHLIFDEDPGSLRQGRAPDVMKYLRAWRPLFTYKEFVPQLERYGVYLPGPADNNFRLVQQWKNMAVSFIQSLGAEGRRPYSSVMPLRRKMATLVANSQTLSLLKSLWVACSAVRALQRIPSSTCSGACCDSLKLSKC